MDKNKLHAIKKILEERNSLLLNDINQLNNIETLSRNTREAIVDELSSELIEKGLNNNDEPTKYGEEIEQLIDFCKLHHDEH